MSSFISEALQQIVYIGSFATDHFFAKDSKNDDLFKRALATDHFFAKDSKNDDLFKRALAHFSSVTRMHDSEFVSGLG